MRPRSLLLPAALLLLGGCFAASRVDRSFNAVTQEPATVSERAAALHRELLTADLHADSLLWNRPIEGPNDAGHVDLARMRAGNHALQAFTIVSKVPADINIDSTGDQGDLISVLAMAQGWPTPTWSSLVSRTLYQAGKLQAAADASDGKFVIIRTRADLAAFLDRRKAEPDLIAGFLGIEGAHALEGNLSNLDVFYDAGVRMVAPTHFFDNDIGGSAHGKKKGGLTPLGRAWVKRMDEKKMIIDLAHASAPVLDEVLRLTRRPIFISHTGVKGTCENNRNLSDDQLRAIARNGGVIGIAFFKLATCGEDVAAVVRAMRHTVDVVGVDHVALGSDFDGMVSTPFDAANFAMLTDALLAEGFTEDDVRKIMGGNVVRLLAALLP